MRSPPALHYGVSYRSRASSDGVAGGAAAMSWVAGRRCTTTDDPLTITNW